MQTLDRVLRPGSSSNRLVRAALAFLALAVSLGSDLTRLLFIYPFGVDLEIPLRATERWRTGGQPYLASAFVSDPGATQPFLYPPYVLPPLSLIVDLPRMAVLVVWCAVCIASFVVICRRLALPVWTWGLLILWPPILEPLIGGNVQLPVVAMFSAVFWLSARNGSAPYQPPERDLLDGGQAGPGIGILAALSAAVKVSQIHPWLAVLRLRPRLALMGAAVIGIFALATVPLTGLAIWGEWFAQLRRATDPAWELGGIAIARLVNPVLGLVAAVGSLVLIVAFLPRRHAGAWVGVIGVVGASSLHLFGTLFLLPAMLIVRRELALLAAMLIATTSYEGTWGGILVVAGAMLFGPRWSALLEPVHPSAS